MGHSTDEGCVAETESGDTMVEGTLVVSVGCAFGASGCRDVDEA